MMELDYRRPESLKEALRILSEFGKEARILAGGTDLLVQLREGMDRWQDLRLLVDISHIKELRYIREEEGIVRIGALATHSDLEKSSLLREAAPFLCKAAFQVGSPQIRNRGTIGGSISNASPAADPVPPLIALGAEALLKSLEGERRLPLQDIYSGSGETVLDPGEILAEISFPRLPKGARSAFVKLGRRKALAISRLNLGVIALQDQEGSVQELRIAPGCIFATPDRVREAEGVLLGKVPTPSLLEEAGLKVTDEMIRRTGIRWSTEFKKPALEALVRRALGEVLEVRE